MGVDAIIVVRARKPSLLTRFAKKHECRLRSLDDGTFLMSTYHGFGAFECGEEWTRKFVTDLAGVHDDSRGVCIFPDILEPRARTLRRRVLDARRHDAPAIVAGLAHAANREIVRLRTT